jgi:HEAT repeat protein
MDVNNLLIQIDNADFLTAEELAQCKDIDLTNANPQIFIAGLSHDKSVIRFVSTKILGELKSTDAITKLCHILVHDEDDDVRWSAAKSLGIIGAQSAIDAMITAINDDCYIVRNYAIKGLIAIGGHKAVNAIIHATHSDDYDTQILSQSALKQLIKA